MLTSYVKTCEKLSPTLLLLKFEEQLIRKGEEKNHNWNDNVMDIT